MNLDTFLNRKNSFYFLLFLFVTFLVFAKSIGYEYFIYDDVEYLKSNLRLTNPTLENIRWFWSDANTKTPLFFNFIQLIFSIWSNQSASVLRIINIAIHAANSFLVFKIVLNLLKKFSGESEKLSIIAFFSSMVFVFHPTQVESIVWVYSMRGVAASFFALSSIYAYLKYLDLNQKKYLLIAAATYLIGMLFKFSIATTPAAFILVDYFLDKEMTIKKSVIKHWVILSFGFFFYFIFVYEYSSEYVMKLKVSNVDAIFISVRTSLHYIEKLFYPFNYRLDYGLNYKNYKEFLPHVWLTRLSILAMVMLNIYSLKVVLTNGKNKYIFCYLFFVILMFPGLGLIPHDFQYSSFVSDRYLYLGILPLCLFLAIGYLKLFELYPKVFPVLPVAVLSLYLLVSFSFVNLWGDTGELLKKSYFANPASDMAYEGVVNFYDSKDELNKITTILWDDTKKPVKHRVSYVKFAKYLGKTKRVREGKIVIQSWRDSKVEFADILLFHLYLEAHLFPEAENQLRVISPYPPTYFKDTGATFNELKAKLEKTRKETPVIFSPWEQMTRRKYNPLSLKIKAEMINRGYLTE